MLIGSPPFFVVQEFVINETNKLTIAERRFYHALLRMNGRQKDAYLLAFPYKKLKNPDTAATKMMKRVRSKCNFDQLLIESGLGLERLMVKMNQMLEAEYTKFYQDQPLGNFTDNGTQMQAAKLLADMHGVVKQVVEHQGTITFTEAIIQNYENRQLRVVGNDEHSDS